MEVSKTRVGATVGRFHIESKLGEGGMGVVYAAYDPELDRRVAIKLLHPSPGGRPSTIDREARLQHEAQTMAKLSHPNVVAIYDVGLDVDRIFIAMELVEGTSLRRWQDQAPRTWRELLAIYLQAGRGLAAGHKAGIVHLDFKPDNVLVARTGQVRVTDFGLARSAEPADAAEPGSLIAGTPCYMAPEQWLGQVTDARTDQFAFCVALWHALYGEHPFDLAPRPRDTGDTLTDSQLALLPTRMVPADPHWGRSLLGRRHPPPRGSRVPKPIARLLSRGLEHRDARHPDLATLLDQLAAVMAPPRWKQPMTLTAVVGGALIAILAWLVARGPDRVDPCATAALAIDDVWGPTQERGIARGLASTGRVDAPEVARRVSGQLARYRDEWRAIRRDTCQASRVQGTQSAALLDLRMQCLDRRLGEVGGLVRVLSETMTASALDRAIPAAHELTPVAACADTAELTAVQPLPPGASLRQAILKTEARLDDVEALRRTGAYRDALARIPALVDEARERAYAPTLARALELHGWLLRATGAAEAAEAVTRDAIRVAAEAHAETIEAAAWTSLLYVVGHMRSRPADAAILRPAADAAVARTGNARLRARLAVTLLTGLEEQGASRDAEALARTELARAEAVLGPEDLDVAAIRGGLATAQWGLGQIDDALATDRQVLATREQVLGDSHPLVGAALVLIGGLLNDRGRYHEARESLERAIAILERALGPDHTEVATALTNLAGSISGEGDSEAARRIHERVLAIREKAFGPESEPVALALNNLGQMLIEVGRGAEAESLLRRSVVIREHRFGPDHEKVARSLTNLAWAFDVTGRCSDAVPLYDRAVLIVERAYGKDHQRVASPLSGRGLCLVDRAPAEAVIALERAARLIADGSDPGLLAMTQFGLARALRKLGRDPARARKLAVQARSYAADHNDPKTVAQVDAWLGDR